MPRYKFTNKITGEVTQFDWNGDEPPDQKTALQIQEQQRAGRLKVQKQAADIPRVERQAFIGQLPQVAKDTALDIGRGAMGFVKSLNPLEAPHNVMQGVANITNRPTPSFGVNPFEPPETIQPDTTPQPRWSQAAGGVADVVGGLLGLGLPAGVAEKGIMGMLKPVVKAVASGTLVEKGAEAVGAPKGVSQLAGLGTGIVVGAKSVPSNVPETAVVDKPSVGPTITGPAVAARRLGAPQSQIETPSPRLLGGPSEAPPAQTIPGRVIVPPVPSSTDVIPGVGATAPPQRPLAPPSPFVQQAAPPQASPKLLPQPPIIPPAPEPIPPSRQLPPGQFWRGPGDPYEQRVGARQVEPVGPPAQAPVVASGAPPRQAPPQPTAVVLPDKTVVPVRSPSEQATELLKQVRKPVKPPVKPTEVPTKKVEAPKEGPGITIAGKPPGGPVGETAAQKALRIAKAVKIPSKSGATASEETPKAEEPKAEAPKEEPVKYAPFSIEDRRRMLDLLGKDEPTSNESEELNQLVKRSTQGVETPPAEGTAPFSKGDIYQTKVGIYHLTNVGPSRVKYNFYNKKGELSKAEMPISSFVTMTERAKKLDKLPDTSEVKPPEGTTTEAPKQQSAVGTLVARINELAGKKNRTAEEDTELKDLKSDFVKRNHEVEKRKHTRGSLSGRAADSVARARASVIEDLIDRKANGEKLTAAEESFLRGKYREKTGPISKLMERLGGTFRTTPRFLNDDPAFRPISSEIMNATAVGDMWEGHTLRRFADTGIDKMTKGDRNKLVSYLNGQPGKYSPFVQNVGNQMRGILDDVWTQASKAGVATKSGSPIRYMKDYFTHIIKRETVPEELKAAMQASYDRLFGKSPPEGKGLMGETERDLPKGEQESRLYDQGVGKPSSPYVEARYGTDLPLETDPRKIIREYVHMMKLHMFEKPAVERVQQHLQRLPDGFRKDEATWYVKNWTRHDLIDEGYRFLRKLDRLGARVGARSVLFGSTRLQVLHLARLGMQVWPELGTKDTFNGLYDFMKNPKASMEQANKYGLLPQGRIPDVFKTAGEKFDNLGNFFDFGNAVVKAITLKANLKKFDGDILKAVNETKRIEGVVGREVPIRALEFLPRSLVQFKYWLGKYSELIGDAAAKKDVVKLGRYLTAALILEELTRRTGVRLYHLKTQSILSVGGPAIETARRVVGDVSKAITPPERGVKTSEDYLKSAGKESFRGIVPGGVSLWDAADHMLQGDPVGALKAIGPLEREKPQKGTRGTPTVLPPSSYRVPSVLSPSR